MLYHIDIAYACFGIVEKDGVVVEAAPIAKWTIGKEINFVLEYYKFRKKAKIAQCV
jgi:hypothetical protein